MLGRPSMSEICGTDGHAQLVVIRSYHDHSSIALGGSCHSLWRMSVVRLAFGYCAWSRAQDAFAMLHPTFPSWPHPRKLLPRHAILVAPTPCRVHLGRHVSGAPTLAESHLTPCELVRSAARPIARSARLSAPPITLSTRAPRSCLVVDARGAGIGVASRGRRGRHDAGIGRSCASCDECEGGVRNAGLVPGRTQALGWCARSLSAASGNVRAQLRP